MIQIESSDAGATLDMTPMIDMVFLLLTFFLAATTFYQSEREMNIVLPSAESSLPITSVLQEIVVNVSHQGEIVVSGRTINAEELSKIIGAAVTGNPQQKVTVRGDQNTAYANIVRVLDTCKTAGIQEPYLDTRVAP